MNQLSLKNPAYRFASYCASKHNKPLIVQDVQNINILYAQWNKQQKTPFNAKESKNIKIDAISYLINGFDYIKNPLTRLKPSRLTPAQKIIFFINVIISSAFIYALLFITLLF